jgi:hypothetical protein
MALDPPMEVVQFLNFIGVHWPMVNEDMVREVAGLVQRFAESVEQTHREATAAIGRMGEAYQGGSYDLLVRRWADMSQRHMSELLAGCHTVVIGLHLAADYIVMMKAVAIGELVALAASFAADQAAAVATLGLAEAAELAIVKAAQKAVAFLEQQLTLYILAEVVETGFKSLRPIIQRAVDGFVFHAASAALGTPASLDPGADGSAGPGASFRIHPGQLRDHAQLLHQHADTVAAHARTLVGQLTGVSFE